jgi:hypothetical protein
MSRSSSQRGPDFIIIGAMKCMTSTLHEQLAAQSGIYMSTPKEPCYFSDDKVYEKGPSWYASLFSGCGAVELCGESSTHYTKLPTYPHTVSRLHEAFPEAKLIYVMRHPIDRLRSQYVHEWTQRMVDDPIDVAISTFPELVHYSRYSYQLAPYLTSFGPDQVLPVFFDRIASHPQSELERICRFLGYRGQALWRGEVEARNISEQRMRLSGWRDRLAYAPGVSWVRRNLVPQQIRNRVKQFWRIKKPVLSSDRLNELKKQFDEDLCRLGDWLGVNLTCDLFRSTTSEGELNWRQGLREQFNVGKSSCEVVL